MPAPDPSVAFPAVSALALAGGAGVLTYGLFAPRSQFFCDTVWHGGPASGPRVAFTFDDGPWPGATEPILDALAAANARACFFVIGRYARAHPALLRRVADEGHLIGNHTFDHHRTGLFRGTAYWLDQLERTDDAVAQIVGVPPRYFRPPMGFKSPPVARAARRSQHTVVAWSRRAYDGVAAHPERITRGASAARPGDIVLMHDGRDPSSVRPIGATAQALPRVLRSIRERGLEPVRLDELIEPR